MSVVRIIRFGFFVAAIVAFFFSYYDFVYADVVSPFQTGGNPESKLNNVFKDIIDFVLYIAMGMGGIGMAWGLAELNGFVGEKKAGMDKIKTGGIVLITAGVLVAVISKLASMST